MVLSRLYSPIGSLVNLELNLLVRRGGQRIIDPVIILIVPAYPEAELRGIRERDSSAKLQINLFVDILNDRGEKLPCIEPCFYVIFYD